MEWKINGATEYRVALTELRKLGRRIARHRSILIEIETEPSEVETILNPLKQEYAGLDALLVEYERKSRRRRKVR